MGFCLGKAKPGWSVEDDTAGVFLMGALPLEADLAGGAVERLEEDGARGHGDGLLALGAADVADGLGDLLGSGRKPAVAHGPSLTHRGGSTT